MDLGLKGKVAIVTGGSRGLGRWTALGLADEGCNVAISARGEETLLNTVQEIESRGVKALGVVGDMARDEDIKRLISETQSKLGGVDILVNNVGGSRGAGFLETNDEHWMDGINVNLMAAVRASRLVLPAMRERGGGRIITISSIYGRESGGTVVYNAVKAAEISLMKSLAREFAKDNVLVNSVAPGSILFPGGGWERRMKDDPERIAAFVKNDMPLGRFGRPEELANVVVFLASERASRMTGACINVDGCQSRSNI